VATDNPKVSGYVPQVVYDQLMQFKTFRGLKSVSMAVTAVFEEYFNLQKAPIDADHDATASHLETLEGKVASLASTVAALSASDRSPNTLPNLAGIAEIFD